MIATPSLPEHFPAVWRTPLLTELRPEETVLAWLECDLDRQLRFANNLVLLTDQRLLAASGDNAAPNWAQWPLHSDWRLRRFDHAGVGTLELCDANGRIAHWRYSLAHATAARHLVEVFRQRGDSLASGQPFVMADEPRCPTCHAPLPPGQDD